jgi:hypothetical protein
MYLDIGGQTHYGALGRILSTVSHLLHVRPAHGGNRLKTGRFDRPE